MVTAYENAKRLSETWTMLCDKFLPIVSTGSIWRYSRKANKSDASQGWKLHVSATVLNAHIVLERVAPLLIKRGVQFKAPASLDILRQINSGLDSSFSQVGKVFTVYPANDAEAVFLARQLHTLTRRLVAPVIPFDGRFRRKSNVYYRYGAFAPREIKLPTGSTTSAIEDPEGRLVPDLYGPDLHKPAWVSKDPFEQFSSTNTPLTDSPLKQSFRAFHALSQRGKGGVYQAIDFTVTPPRLCLLKEGRRAGEVGWDRRDGRRRIKHETKVLAVLRKRGIKVPEIYSSFESDGHFYLVTEFLAGENLHSLLLRRQRRLRIYQVLNYAFQVATLLAELHSAGWIWRDCKPGNLILTKKKELKPLDFEGACRLNKPENLSWATPGFKCPQGTSNYKGQSVTKDDIYALGALTYLLLTGRLPDNDRTPTPAENLRRNTPPALSLLLAEMLDVHQNSNLSAMAVRDRLGQSLRSWQR